MAQRKVERYHCSMKSQILLENYYLPDQLEEFVHYHNNRRCHESRETSHPLTIYFARGQTILKQRARIKRKTVEQPRPLHQEKAA